MSPTDTAIQPTAETTVPETAKAITKFKEAHAHEVGLPSPQAVNYMFSVANMLYSSALVGKDMGLSKDQVARLQSFGITGERLEARDKAAVIANGMAKMLVGRELGIEPMAAWLDIDLVKTKIFVRYPQLHRLIEEKGYTIEEMERSEIMASIKLTHQKKPTRIFEFSFEDAKRAGLTKRGGYNNDSPSQYDLRPRVMLWARVISEAYRATGGKGSVYTIEEKREILANEDEPNTTVPTPEHDPYAVQMPQQAPAASSDVRAGENGGKVTPTPSPRSSEAELRKRGTMEDPLYARHANSAAPILESAANGSAPSPGAAAGGIREDAVTDAPEAVATASNPVSEPAPPIEMPQAKTNGGPTLADIEKMLPAKTRKKTIDEFLRGYFRKADLKAIIADPGFPDALRCLAANATAEWKGKLEADPHGVGVKCANGWKKLKAYAWSPETRGYLETLALKLYPDAGGGLLADMLTLVRADDMAAEELQAFLWVLERVPDTAAVKFWKRCAGMAAMVAEWEGVAPPLTTTQIADAIEALPEPQEGEQGSLLTEGA